MGEIRPCEGCKLAIEAPATHCSKCMRKRGEVSFWLPFPPSVNNLFSHGVVKGRVRRFPSKHYKRWQKAAEVYLLEQRVKRFKVPVIIKLELTPRDTRARDADNYNKAVIDCLVKCRVIPGDDAAHVKAVSSWWRNPAKKAGATIWIRPAANLERPALNAAERDLLERIQRAGTLLMRPTSVKSEAMSLLLKKGWIRELPGLIDDCPQGYIALEAIGG